MSQISPAEVWILKYIHVNQMRKRMRKTHLLLNYLKCFNTKLWELKWESTFKYWIKWLKKKKDKTEVKIAAGNQRGLCEWVRVLAKVSAKDDTEIEELGGFSHPHLVCHFYIPESRLVGPAPPHSSTSANTTFSNYCISISHLYSQLHPTSLASKPRATFPDGPEFKWILTPTEIKENIWGIKLWSP